MAATSISSDRKSARLALVQQHVQMENEHHLEGVLSTFGETAQYQDEAWGDSYPGRDGVRSYYEQLMAALPDLDDLRNSSWTMAAFHALADDTRELLY